MCFPLSSLLMHSGTCIMQDVAEKDTKPSPAASPEDLAAIAALEAGGDVVLQPPRTPTPPSELPALEPSKSPPMLHCSLCIAVARGT